MNWLDIIKAVVPIVLSSTGKKELVALAPVISSGIIQAEQLVGAKGAEKLVYAKNLTTMGFIGYNAAMGTEKFNIQAVDETVTNSINSAVAIANLIIKK